MPTGKQVVSFGRCGFSFGDLLDFVDLYGRLLQVLTAVPAPFMLGVRRFIDVLQHITPQLFKALAVVHDTEVDPPVPPNPLEVFRGDPAICHQVMMVLALLFVVLTY